MNTKYFDIRNLKNKYSYRIYLLIIVDIQISTYHRLLLSLHPLLIYQQVIIELKMAEIIIFLSRCKHFGICKLNFLSLIGFKLNLRFPIFIIPTRLYFMFLYLCISRCTFFFINLSTTHSRMSESRYSYRNKLKFNDIFIRLMCYTTLPNIKMSR